jgi:hypothetical protein
MLIFRGVCAIAKSMNSHKTAPLLRALLQRHLNGPVHERLHGLEEYAVARKTFRRQTQHLLKI